MIALVSAGLAAAGPEFFCAPSGAFGVVISARFRIPPSGSSNDFPHSGSRSSETSRASRRRRTLTPEPLALVWWVGSAEACTKQVFLAAFASLLFTRT
jgi:hypothetical protein